MVINKLKLALLTSVLLPFFASPTLANNEISTNIARMQAMDKITGMVRVIDLPVNSEVKYGSFSIVVRACKTRPPEETPENFAFVDIIDDYKGDNPHNIFRGWMVSSSPSLNSVEHPIYDIWLLNCENGKVDPRLKIMSDEELNERDKMPAQISGDNLNPDKEQGPKMLVPEIAEDNEQSSESDVKKEGTIEKASASVKVVKQEEKLDFQEGDGNPKSLISLQKEQNENPKKEDDKELVTSEIMNADGKIAMPTTPQKENSLENRAEEEHSVLSSTSELKEIKTIEDVPSEDKKDSSSLQKNEENVSQSASENDNALSDSQDVVVTEGNFEEIIDLDVVEENGMAEEQLIDFSE